MNQLQTTQEEAQPNPRDKLVVYAKGAVIASEADLAVAVDNLSSIKRFHAAAEKDRKGLTDPINASLKSINARYKTITEPLEEAERILKQKVGSYQLQLEMEKRRKAEEETKRTQEALREAAKTEADAGNADGAMALAQAVHTINVKPEESGRGTFTGAKTSLVSKWVFEVTDIEALATARPDLVIANDKMVNAVIKAGAREIPGLAIREEKIVSVRG